MIFTIVIIMVFIAAFILGMFIFRILSMGKNTRLNKGLNKTLKELSKMENAAEIKELKRRINILECEHNNIESNVNPYIFSSYGVKKCLDCGKILNVYYNKKDFLIAKKEFANEELKEITNEIKDLPAAGRGELK